MKKKVLVVDDEPHIVRTLQIRLEANNYTVLVATSGEEALKSVSLNNPDLIILDVMMPPPNGFQVCRQLKNDEKYKNIPIIMLTAKGSESDRFWGIEAGADKYFSKPFNSTELLEAIKELLGQEK